MNELIKPCPFCGTMPYLEKKPLWTSHGGITHGYFGCYEYVIKCNNPECQCNVRLSCNDTIYHSDKEAKSAAFEAWNKRC